MACTGFVRDASRGPFINQRPARAEPSENSSTSGCGLSMNDGVRKRISASGDRLVPASAPACSYRFSTGVLADGTAVIGTDIHNAAPLAHGQYADVKLGKVPASGNGRFSRGQTPRCMYE